MKSTTTMKKTMLVSCIALALGATTEAQAIKVPDVLGLGLGVKLYTDSANLTMLSPEGATFAGTNNVSMVWDGNAYTSSSDYTGPGGPSNITASTTTPFFGLNWTAHDIQVFVPGTYSFDTALGGGNPEQGTLSATVPIGNFGVHMLFDWNGNYNIDVFVVAAELSMFGSGIGRSSQNYTTASGSMGNYCDEGIIKNCLYDGRDFGSAGKPAGSTTWMLASIDGNGDGIMGIPMMAGGPFEFFNANFNANMSPMLSLPKLPVAVPIPATAWLFISGLMGMLGMARRRRR